VPREWTMGGSEEAGCLTQVVGAAAVGGVIGPWACGRTHHACGPG
jgi:hypothetical protein